MPFENALDIMKYKGKRVKRKKWSSAYLFVEGDQLLLGRDGSNRVYPIKSVDTGCIMSDDWEIYE